MAHDRVLARIHILRKERGLDEETYRDLVERETGQRSLKGLNDKDRRKVLLALSGKSHRKASSNPMVRKVFAIWGDMCQRGTWKDTRRSSLRAFIKRMAGVDDPEWMNTRQAAVVIEALKKMDERG